MRFVLVLSGAAAVLAGCLFPSFDDLKKPGAAAGDDDDQTTNPRDSGVKDASASSSGSSGTTSSGGSSSASSSSSSSGDAGPPTKSITCGGGLTCSGEQVCCKDFIGDPTCKAASPKPDCDSVIVCDGAEDCGTGRCCQDGTGGINSVCKTKCDNNEYTYCHVDSECPPNEKCTGTTVAAGPASNLGLKFCE